MYIVTGETQYFDRGDIVKSELCMEDDNVKVSKQVQPRRMQGR